MRPERVVPYAPGHGGGGQDGGGGRMRHGQKVAEQTHEGDIDKIAGV